VGNDVQSAQFRRGGGISSGHTQGGGIHQFNGGKAGRHQLRKGGGGAVQRVKEHQSGGHLGQGRHGPERGFGHETQGAFTAHHQVGQDVHRTFVVQESIEPVAHGVLHGKQPLDGGYGLGVGDDASAKPQQTLKQFGFQGAQFCFRIRGCGVNQGSGREDQHHGVDGLVRVEFSAAGHAGRVVGYHAANGAGDFGGGVGAELPSVCGEPGVHGGHLLGSAGSGHGLGDHQVVGGIVGHFAPVDVPGADVLGAEVSYRGR